MLSLSYLVFSAISVIIRFITYHRNTTSCAGLRERKWEEKTGLLNGVHSEYAVDHKLYYVLYK